MTLGSGPASPLGPTHLPFPHAPESHRRNDMIDDVPRKQNSISCSLNKIAGNEIVGEIFASYPVASNFCDGVFPRHNRWPESKFHSFQQKTHVTMPTAGSSIGAT